MSSYEINVEIRGERRLARQMEAIADMWPDKSDPIIGKHATKFAKNMRNKPYPPELPGQKYIRTFLLGSRFKAKHAGLPKGVHGVENKVSYAIWVAKRGMQNRQYHLGRWWTLEDEAEKTLPELEANLVEMLEDLIARQRD